MKNIITTLFLSALICGCQPTATKWEYRTEVVETDPKHILESKIALRKAYPTLDTSANDGDERFGRWALDNLEFNKLGQEGWELVSAVTQTETVWPTLDVRRNFDGSKFVAEREKISNTRTSRIIFIFKRPLTSR